MSALLSAVELAMARDYDQGDPKEWHNKIPPMLHPMGKNWDQPNVSNFLIDDTHVLMTKGEFDALHDYSHSFPTGVYPGKCWRRAGATFGEWFLIWFGYSEKPDCCSNNWRRILIA